MVQTVVLEALSYLQSLSSLKTLAMAKAMTIRLTNDLLEDIIKNNYIKYLEGNVT